VAIAVNLVSLGKKAFWPPQPFMSVPGTRAMKMARLSPEQQISQEDKAGSSPVLS
jgi:hypothetical protein